MSEVNENQEPEKTSAELLRKLKGKEKAFALFYVGKARFNGAEAVKLAGYDPKDSIVAAVMACQLKKKDRIRDFIDAKMAEDGMQATEILARLSQIARGTINDVIGNSGTFDLEQARENGSIHLVKKLKTKRTIMQKKTEVTESMKTFLAEDEVDDIETQTEIIHEEIEFELHDPHAALIDLGKHHKLFTQKVDLAVEVETADVVIYIPDNGRD